MPGTMGGLNRQSFGVHHNPSARPSGNHCIEASHQPRHAFDKVGDSLQSETNSCFGTAIVAHPLFNQRPSKSSDVDLGIETTPHALDDDHGFLQQQELRLRFHVELLGDLEELREQAGDRDLLQRSAEDGFAD